MSFSINVYADMYRPENLKTPVSTRFRARLSLTSDACAHWERDSGTSPAAA